MGPLRNHCNNPRAILVALGGDFSLIRSGRLLPPSPPAEKATARQDQTGKASTDDGARNGRSRKSGHLNAVNEARA